MDKLKKLGIFNAEGLIKVEVNNYYVDNSQKIEVNDSEIKTNIKTVGNQKINYTLPNAVEYDDVKPYIKELYKKKISGFVRKDLALPEVGMLSARQRRKEIFRYYKCRIKSEHYYALTASYAIMEFEDNGDYKTSNEIFSKMIKRHREDGRHIYNFCRSGLMEGFFWNELGFIIVQGATEPIIRKKFSETFDSYVQFYPYAVWVAPLMNFDDIVDELRIRLEIKEVQRLNLYFRGKDKLELAEQITELIEQKKNLKIESIERYSIFNSPCICLTIAKTGQFKEF